MLDRIGRNERISPKYWYEPAAAFLTQELTFVVCKAGNVDSVIITFRKAFNLDHFISKFSNLNLDPKVIE